MYISALWPDGSVMTGESFSELEEELRCAQWSEMTTQELLQAMQHRAEVLTGCMNLDISNAEAMFRGLEQLDMVRLDVEA